MNAVYWLIALAVFLIIEIITLGLTTIWFAGGAFAGFMASMAGLNIWLQFLLFIIVSFVLLYFTRPVVVKYFNKKREKTNIESLSGKIARVLETIDNLNNTGSVDLNGQVWTARTQEDNRVISVGTQVKVVEIKGVKLIVTDYVETD